jgi:hypothetical protein
MQRQDQKDKDRASNARDFGEETKRSSTDEAQQHVPTKAGSRPQAAKRDGIAKKRDAARNGRIPALNPGDRGDIGFLNWIVFRSVNAWQITKLKDMSDRSLKCSSPVCEARFEQTGILRMEPRKYCCEGCRMDAWALRRVGKLYGLTVEEMHEALSNSYRRGRQ